jgi:hypothetical protein
MEINNKNLETLSLADLIALERRLKDDWELLDLQLAITPLTSSLPEEIRTQYEMATIMRDVVKEEIDSRISAIFPNYKGNIQIAHPFILESVRK